MKRTTVYLKRTQIEMLKRLARRTGVPFSGLIRQGVDMLIAERKAEKPTGRPSPTGN
jgi:hypothetical protein